MGPALRVVEPHTLDAHVRPSALGKHLVQGVHHIALCMPARLLLAPQALGRVSAVLDCQLVTLQDAAIYGTTIYHPKLDAFYYIIF